MHADRWDKLIASRRLEIPLATNMPMMATANTVATGARPDLRDALLVILHLIPRMWQRSIRGAAENTPGDSPGRFPVPPRIVQRPGAWQSVHVVRPFCWSGWLGRFESS